MTAGNPVTYQVSAVTSETRYSPTATPIPGKNVSFSTSIGYEGTVFIPDSVFADLSAVRQVITAEVAAVAAAHALTGTVNG